MSPTGDCNDWNQAPASPGSVADLPDETCEPLAATSKYSPDMIGYHIDKKLYTSLENHLVHLILEEALAKAKKDDKIDQEKFKRLNEVRQPLDLDASKMLRSNVPHPISAIRIVIG
ncbi:UNVERIFIED_CONTAM: hypothetical protein HDU68_003967 [Siphonaria sp. JEL0065]|nr:hypothetical protein HDU68_003967 [Siphonaria sp. JEL0065]